MKVYFVAVETHKLFLSVSLCSSRQPCFDHLKFFMCRQIPLWNDASGFYLFPDKTRLVVTYESGFVGDKRIYSVKIFKFTRKYFVFGASYCDAVTICILLLE